MIPTDRRWFAEPLLPRIEDRLALGTWEPNREWRPERSKSAGNFRWRFRSASDEAAEATLERARATPASATDEETSSWPPAPDSEASDGSGASSSWDGRRRFDGSLADLLAELDEVTEGLANRVLQRLAERPGKIGRNAAIVLARRNPLVAPAERLAEVVLDDGESAGETALPGWDAVRSAWGRADSGSDAVSSATRMAACEAWVGTLASKEGDPEEALAPIGRVLEGRDLPVAIRAELVRAVGRHVPPALLPFAEEVFDDTAAARAPRELRRALADACVAYAVTHPAAPEEAWPRSFRFARHDEDADVRKTFGLWLAVTRDPEAVATLVAQLDDTSPSVRDAAIASLGRSKTDEARAELERLAGRRGERLRSLAVTALAEWGVAAVERFADDESHAVRTALAEALAPHEGESAAIVLSGLAADANLGVEAAAVAATDHWSLERAAPVLFTAMEDGAWATREKAFRALRRHRPDAWDFRVDAPAPERRRAVERIASRLELPRTATRSAPAPTPDRAEEGDRQRPAEVRSLVVDLGAAVGDVPRTRLLKDRLAALSAEDVPRLEAALEAAAPEAVSVVARDVLPDLSPVHAALADLEHGDVHSRREAARRLSELGRGSSLSPFAVRRLRDGLASERDRLVWRYALQAIEADVNTGVDGIVQLALNHTWPDVRRAGCEYVARHGRPHHASWLLPLFRDDEENVRLAAVEAAGRCHNAIVVEGVATDGDRSPVALPALLTDADARVRLAAAIALGRLNDPVGVRELVRRSRSGDPAERLAVIEAMGETGNRAFVEPLVTLGWSERDLRVRRTVLDTLDRLVPPRERPRSLDSTAPDDVRLRVWGEWLEENGDDLYVRSRATPGLR